MKSGTDGTNIVASLNREEKEEKRDMWQFHPFGGARRSWYVIHTYSGYENKVKANLEKRVASMEMGDKIFMAFVPMEKRFETKNGQRKTVMQKLFPGYVLVEMVIDDISWFVVRNTPGVNGFVGAGPKPVPLTEEEIDRIFKRVGLDDATPRVKFDFKEKVRVACGPLHDFTGTVEEVDQEKAKLRVTISMFGRETPVDLGFDQVEKL